MNDLDSGAYELTPITDNAAFVTFDKQEVVPIEVSRSLERLGYTYQEEIRELKDELKWYKKRVRLINL